jgi:hypothetical protein
MKPTQGTVIRVGAGNVDVRCDRISLLAAVAISAPLTEDEISSGDVVALSWKGETPYAHALLTSSDGL